MKKIKAVADTSWLSLIASLFAIHFGSIWGGFVGDFLVIIGWVYVGFTILVALLLGVAVVLFILSKFLVFVASLFNKNSKTQTPEEIIASVKKQRKKTTKRGK